MKRAALSLVLVASLAAGVLAYGASSRPALADYNISGDWMIDFGGGPCAASIVETATQTSSYDLSIVGCNVPAKLRGIINIQSGAFHVYINTEFDMNGSVSPDKQTISGVYYSAPPGQPRTYGNFAGQRAPPPVGGLSIDAPAPRNDSPSMLLLIAAASASLVAIAGAAWLTRKRS